MREPLLLLPIAFGILVVNLPLTYLMEPEHGLIWFFYHYGIELDIIPPLIFLGLGAMIDFGPLIANPKTLIIGAGAQLGVFITYIGVLFFGFTLKEAASVGIIGGADGHFDDHEKAAVRNACFAVGIDPAEFEL